MDILKTILITTYSTCLPVILGLVVSQIKDYKKAKKEHQDSSQKLNEKIDNLTKIVEEDRAMTARYRIIRYDDEERHGVEHSEDHKMQIMDDINCYNRYCKDHPDFINHRGQNAMRRILNDDMNQEYV